MERKDEQLYQRLRQHEEDITHGKEKDITLVTEVLRYIFEENNDKELLPDNDQLSKIISKSYEADGIVKLIEEERTGQVREEGSNVQRPPNDHTYTTLLSCLDQYLWCKVQNDDSPEVSTPEKAQEYVQSLRTGIRDFMEAMFKETTEHLEWEDHLMRAQMMSGFFELISKTDADFIAKASKPYTQTEEGKERFKHLQEVVEQIINNYR